MQLKIKAEIGAEVLIYILALFIISLVIVVGYNYTKSVQKTQKISSYIIFRNIIKNDIEGIKNDFGRVSKKEYALPEGVDEICFIDKGAANPLLCTGCQPSTDYMDMIKRISENSTNNIFLLEDFLVSNNFRLEKIKIGCCQFRCFKAENGRLKITLEGDGKFSQISK